MGGTRRGTARRPIWSHRPICRPNAATVRHGKEVGNEQSTGVGLLRADANADQRLETIHIMMIEMEYSRIAGSTDGQGGNIVDGQNGGAIVLDESQILLDRILTSLEVDKSVSGVGVGEKVPFTKATVNDINSSVVADEKKYALEESLPLIHVLQLESPRVSCVVTGLDTGASSMSTVQRRFVKTASKCGQWEKGNQSKERPKHDEDRTG